MLELLANLAAERVISQQYRLGNLAQRLERTELCPVRALGMRLLPNGLDARHHVTAGLEGSLKLVAAATFGVLARIKNIPGASAVLVKVDDAFPHHLRLLLERRYNDGLR